MLIASVADNTMDESIVEMLEQFQLVVEAGYDSEVAAAVREELRAQIPAPSPELATKLIPWVEGLLRDLRAIAEVPEEQWDCGLGGHRFMSPQDEHCNVCNDWVGAVEP